MSDEAIEIIREHMQWHINNLEESIRDHKSEGLEYSVTETIRLEFQSALNEFMEEFNE